MPNFRVHPMLWMASLIANVLPASAQTVARSATESPSPRPEFEVASVKLNTSGSGASSSNGSKGGIVYTNVTLKSLIEEAYSVKPFQIVGPGWMEDVRFDILAKNQANTTLKDRPPMLRALLEDRFKLTVHRGSKEMPGYVLLVDKRGLKLRPVEPNGDSSENESGGRIHFLSARRMSIASLADLIARSIDATVVDKTGVQGVYDFALRWTSDELKGMVGDADAAPSLSIALQETLGLRLHAEKVAVEIIMVDHVERIPTEN